MLVPPMSRVTASGIPAATAAAAAGQNPAGRPGHEQADRPLGRLLQGDQAPRRGHDQDLTGEGGQAAQVGAAGRTQVGVDHGGDGPLVLPELRGHLVRAGHVQPPAAELGGQRPLVGRVAVGVQEADRHRVDAAGERRPSRGA